MAEIDVYKEWLGIPEGDRPPDNYTLLRVVMFEDNVDKIQTNYRKLNAHVRKYATGQYLKESQDLLNEMAKAMLCLTDPDAKQEYDESLGREAPQQDDGDEPRTVLQYLVSKNVIKRGQVAEIESFADARGLTHRDAVVQMKLADQTQATQALATELRMSFVDLDDMLPEDDVLDRLPRNVVKRHRCLPLFEDRGKLLVACVDEPPPDLEDEIRLRFGMPMRGVLAVPRSIQQSIAKYYAPGERDEAAAANVPAATGKTKKGGAAGKAKPAKAKPGVLTPEDKAQRQQISIIIILWSLIGTTLAIHFTGFMGMGTGGMIGCGLAVAGAVAGILKATYWK
ncbi:general secretion pathway protein GspE [Fuerstiella marisgermanici]|uniref:Bacteriophage N4 adsorption protein B n=1 Tax=Fuerstiella marisgermanici TaxID=1891926 RepID=A0A1P8WSL7_9PLAN|nr:general secretion pathway protein GspE [Fuerstiella marisgermanici]APZ97049.1 bacteriophage N4 adsorption protein B [Fuerstiella marisgermanici]